MKEPHTSAAFERIKRGPRWADMDGYAKRAAVSALLAEGYSTSRIGDALETTRGAVGGFIDRNGLSTRVKAPGAGHVDLSRPKNERSAAGGYATRKKAGVTLANHAARPSVGGSADFSAAIAVVVAPADAPEPVAPPSGGVGFMALTAQHCRRPLWPNGSPPPLSGMFFCGARVVAGSSWCRACTPRLTAPTPGLIRARNRAYGAAPSEPAAPAHLPHKGGGFDPVNPAAGAAS